MEFKKISELEQLESLSDSANVLVEDGGMTKRFPAAGIGAFDYASYGLPVVYLTGDTSAMSKENKVEMSYVYKDYSGTAKVKWQGSSALAYPKKNYTITFDTAFEAADGWGAQAKYCLKANWVDFSHARNVCSAKLWGIMRKEGYGEDVAFYNQPNCGAIDGFPVALVINGAYQGLYSFCIPKDAWMFGFTGENEMECIITAEVPSSDATGFKAAALIDGSDFEFEYVADESKKEDLIASFNQIYSKLTWLTDIDTPSFSALVDITSAIDYYIFATMFQANDGYRHNFLVATADGQKWVFAPYDLDTVFGNFWTGESYYNAANNRFENNAGESALFNLIYTHEKQRLITRYRQLRQYQLSEARVAYVFYNYLAGIPKAYFDEEVKLWKEIPGTSTNNIHQIMEHYRIRCARLDAEIDAMEAAMSSAE